MRSLVLAVAGVLFLLGAEDGLAAKHKKAQTLFKRLGGQKALVAVVDSFVGKCAADERIKSFFEPAAADPKRLKHFKKMLVQQLCAGTGGKCKYKGKDMKVAHAGMGVKEEHFNALVENLVKTLDEFKVPDKEKNELLGILGPMKGDIVESSG